MTISSGLVYRENRSKFSTEELRKFADQWVAFSADGRCIIASGPTIADLASLVRAANRNLQDLVLERIEAESLEINLGGAEFL